MSNHRLLTRFVSLFLMIFLSWVKIYSQTEAVRINEFLALNQTILTDEDGDHSDWIELYNPLSVDIDLLGWSLSDNKSQSKMWVFPDMTLKGGSYLIVFASGKNRRQPGRELHTNFNISGDGEYLALFNSSGKAVTEFSPSFPVQQTDISYGFHDGSYLSFKTPTPGTMNLPGGTLPPPPVFSKRHGFYFTPFSLEISSSDPLAKIYFTTDGSAPGSQEGILYSGPVNISTTAIIRAVCVRDDKSSSTTVTQTYLFPDDIIHQPNDPAGYPSVWGPFLTLSGDAPADYEMDPEMMSDPVFANIVKEALVDLPVVSLVTDRDHLFSKTIDPATGGIYIYTGTSEGLGYGWERPASFEYFDRDNSLSLQVNCGLRIHGGESRRPDKSPKHSFRLIFRDEYGPSKLNFKMFGDDAGSEYNTIVLRAGFNNTWLHQTHNQRSMAQYIRDRWTKDTQMEMGYHASHGSYAHLFINGLYWGVYNPSERLDSDFAEEYIGGEEQDYDVIKDYTEAVDGYLTSWNTTIAMANAGLKANEAYQRLLGNFPDGTRNPLLQPMVDVVNLADYMILNFFGSNSDWDHHNWVAIRNRINPGRGFQFFCWDAEHMIEGVTTNILAENNDKCPSRIFQQLLQNADFRRLFADRVQKLCFNNGVLTPSRNADRWSARALQIDKAINAESARWGDYRRDVHPWVTAGPFQLYTKETHWIAQRDYLLNTYFPNRTNNFLGHLRKAGLFPSVNGPVFLINNDPVTENEIASGSKLTMESEEGAIYYTTDGNDPVTWGSSAALSPKALRYLAPLVITKSSHFKARVLHNDEWSAASEQFLTIPGDFKDLKITEIHYHPADDETMENREFEFIEIKNTGDGTLDLGGIKLSEAVEFEFPPETELEPQSFIVLASNFRGFYNRYGFLPFNEYKGQLDNNGEMIFIISEENDTLCRIFYEDINGWPEGPDGKGKSLVPIDINPAGDQNNPERWRESYAEGGSPGEDDIYVLQTGTAKSLATIYQNYPNPFSEATLLHYELHEDAHVQLSVVDFTGNIIVILEDADRWAGHYETEWKGLNGNNCIAGNGLYFYRLVVRNRNGTNVLARKMILIR